MEEVKEVDVILANHIERMKDELDQLKFSIDDMIEYFERIQRVANAERNRLLKEKVIQQNKKQ